MGSNFMDLSLNKLQAVAAIKAQVKLYVFLFRYFMSISAS